MKVINQDLTFLEWVGLFATIFGFLLGVVSIFFHDARIPAAILLGTCLVALIGHMLWSRITRTYLVLGEAPVLHELVRRALGARDRVWTARGHLGEPEKEDEYFRTLMSRITDTRHPLRDVRRLIALNAATGTQEHLEWLIDKLGDQVAVKVRTTDGGGPSFDFAVIDKDFGILGFPAAGAEGFDGAVCFRDRSAIDGLERAFNDLWQRATPLMSGARTVDENRRRELKMEVRRRIEALGHDDGLAKLGTS